MIKTNVQIGDENLLLQQFFSGKQAGIWTAIPGIIQSFDPEALTCEVQPAIKGRRREADGTIKVENLPLLLDCPVVFPRGGGCSLTFPIKPGDECLVVFASRGIDFWWQNGGIQPPPEPRMHDLSDGFVIPGPYSQPKKIGNVNTSAVQLRSDDGEAYLEINPDSHDIKINTSGDFSSNCKNFSLTAENVSFNCNKFDVNSPQINLNGAINGGGSGGANATFTGDVKAGSVSLKTHTHKGTQPGNGNTGQPNG